MYILYFRGEVYVHITLPIRRVRQNESGIVNLVNVARSGTHWVAYTKSGNRAIYFDNFGNFRENRRENWCDI